jgi:hypothetical protein
VSSLFFPSSVNILTRYLNFATLKLVKAYWLQAFLQGTIYFFSVSLNASKPSKHFKQNIFRIFTNCCSCNWLV